MKNIIVLFMLCLYNNQFFSQNKTIDHELVLFIDSVDKNDKKIINPIFVIQLINHLDSNSFSFILNYRSTINPDDIEIFRPYYYKKESSYVVFYNYEDSLDQLHLKEVFGDVEPLTYQVLEEIQSETSGNPKNYFCKYSYQCIWKNGNFCRSRIPFSNKREPKFPLNIESLK